ncbi:MAG: hypothetical protein WAM07_04355 [Halobacillus sp.]|uniref:hypothetical protein n=1 Tax=Halobacillus sp. TaxID=56800 RepID=UPI003BB1D43E
MDYLAIAFLYVLGYSIKNKLSKENPVATSNGNYDEADENIETEGHAENPAANSNEWTIGTADCGFYGRKITL